MRRVWIFAVLLAVWSSPEAAAEEVSGPEKEVDRRPCLLNKLRYGQYCGCSWTSGKLVLEKNPELESDLCVGRYDVLDKPDNSMDSLCLVHDKRYCSPLLKNRHEADFHFLLGLKALGGDPLRWIWADDPTKPRVREAKRFRALAIKAFDVKSFMDGSRLKFRETLRKGRAFRDRSLSYFRKKRSRPGLTQVSASIGDAGDDRLVQLSPEAIGRLAGSSVVLLIGVDPKGEGDLGAGVVIDDRGRILTSAHVVIRMKERQPFGRVIVHRSGKKGRALGKPMNARVVAWDGYLDIAVVELDKPRRGLTPVVIGDTAALEDEPFVFTVGHPEDQGPWTVSRVRLSPDPIDQKALGKDFIASDARFDRGYAGGPLLNRRGALIGMNTSFALGGRSGSLTYSVRAEAIKAWLDASVAGLDYWVEVAEPADEGPSGIVEVSSPMPPRLPSPSQARPFKIGELLSRHAGRSSGRDR